MKYPKLVITGCETFFEDFVDYDDQCRIDCAIAKRLDILPSEFSKLALAERLLADLGPSYESTHDYVIIELEQRLNDFIQDLLINNLQSSDDPNNPTLLGWVHKWTWELQEEETN